MALMLILYRRTHRLPILLLTLLWASPMLYSQNTNEAFQYSSSGFQYPTSEGFQSYQASVKNQLLIYNGIQYIPFKKPYRGSPYFMNNSWETGRVIYDGDSYDGLTMMYDQYTDKLILEHYDRVKGAAHVQLNSRKISSFEVHQTTFVFIPEDSAGDGEINSGFYDLQYDGKIDFLVRRRKTLKEDITSNTLTLEFQPETRYYIQLDGHYIEISNKRTLKKAVGEDKKMISEFIKSNKLKFNKHQIESSILHTIKFYDGKI